MVLCCGTFHPTVVSSFVLVPAIAIAVTDVASLLLVIISILVLFVSIASSPTDLFIGALTAVALVYSGAIGSLSRGSGY